MPRERQGSVTQRKDGSIWARVIYTDASGKKRDLQRRAVNRTEAKRIIKDILSELEERGERGLEGHHMTFRQLAERYEKHKLFLPEYIGTRKVAGIKSARSVKVFLGALVSRFGNQPIRDITHADIADYKRQRMQSPVLQKAKTKKGEIKITNTGRSRAIASINRELATMRSVLNFAKRNKWLISNPFGEGDTLISQADETRRERVLSIEEERVLLATCLCERIVTYTRKGKTITAKITKGREHLRPLIIVALDTGMRKGELFKLIWKDINFASKCITVLAQNTKTAKPRVVAMTSRVESELRGLWQDLPPNGDGLVFGISDTVKKSWTSVCKDAKIEGLNFHDLRHTAITRLINAGVPPMEVMKISGHTQMATFVRYINPTLDTVRRAADALESWQALQIEKPTSKSEMVN